MGMETHVCGDGGDRDGYCGDGDDVETIAGIGVGLGVTVVGTVGMGYIYLSPSSSLAQL